MSRRKQEGQMRPFARREKKGSQTSPGHEELEKIVGAHTTRTTGEDPDAAEQGGEWGLRKGNSNQGEPSSPTKCNRSKC